MTPNIQKCYITTSTTRWSRTWITAAWHNLQRLGFVPSLFYILLKIIIGRSLYGGFTEVSAPIKINPQTSDDTQPWDPVGVHNHEFC